MNNTTYLFLHIPKTGGTTTQSYIRGAFNYQEQYFIDGSNIQESIQNFSNLTDDEKRKYKLIRGHFQFGLHNLVPGKTSYITIIRNPIERTVSQYLHAKRITTHPHYNTIHKYTLSLADYITSEKIFMRDNVQTSMIGGFGKNMYGKSYDQQEFVPSNTMLTRKHLNYALDNINSHFGVIGIIDDLHSFVNKLNEVYGWSIEFDNRTMNSNPDKRNDYKNILDDRSLEAIRSKNEFDLELYEYIKTM